VEKLLSQVSDLRKHDEDATKREEVIEEEVEGLECLGQKIEKDLAVKKKKVEAPEAEREEDTKPRKRIA
jgi:hypothetical protein